MSKTWFITGASRGLGTEIARAALAAGHNVVATARRPETVTAALGESDRLLALPLDVTDGAQAERAVADAVARFGTIDVLVNNAGYGQFGVFEEVTPEDVRAQFETNVFGLMNVTRAAVPTLREGGSGHVFNISSIAGLRGMFGFSIYAASKFAVEGFSQGLADELAPLGIKVTVVSPGYFRTDFLESTSIKYSENPIAAYAERQEGFRTFHDERNQNQPGDPKKLAAALLQLAEEENPPVSFVVGTDAVEWSQGAIDRFQGELTAWKDLSASTDGDW
ncbi:SDR family NAD(P)-dependent oxidoreductase [bacterium]|nr:MAG: SDR family NAD(P)-dependent oxidoreductase [bacterium]